MKNICHQMSRKVWLAAILTLVFAFPALAQTITVTGTVIDPEGEPLIGASVLVKGETLGTATNLDGEFTLKAPADGTLIVSYVGYDTQEIAIEGRTTIHITMATNSLLLNEVVAIGYGTVKRTDATGSVATVKPSEIEAGLATSAQDMLVGASPGVVVTTNGGDPSGSASITIRGGASLAASNDPLIVIDGVPMDTKGVKGLGNPLALVSPENVESMTILKGASATAIFGSRASNGVIIITSKKGQSGRPQVSFTANAYLNTTRKYLDVMNGDEFRNLILTHYGEGSTQAGQLGDFNTDWQRSATRTTLSSDYSLSVGGTAGWLPYRVSVSYTNNNGILKKSAMDRVSGSINLNPKFFNNALQISANVKGAYINTDDVSNPMGSCVNQNPTMPIHNWASGDPRLSYWTTYNGAGQWNAEPIMNQAPSVNNTTAPINPISSQMGREDNGKAYQSTGNLQIDWRLPSVLKDVRANLNLGYDYQHGEKHGGLLPNTPSAWADGYAVLVEKDGKMEQTTIRDGGTSAYKDFQTRVNLLLDFYLNYNKTIESINSSIDVSAGYSWQKFHNKVRTFTYVNRVGDPANEKYLGVQASPTDITIEPLQLVSFWGRANFVFLDKYLLTASVRRDGTSRFSKDNRWGTFPSFAIGWKILEENFMEGARGYLNELKLRADYGVTGQQDLGGSLFPYLPVYSYWTGNTTVYPNLTNPNGDPIHPVQPEGYNSTIKWEETHTWGAGVDFGFMNNRIVGSLDFYRRKTKDLLTNTSYPAGSNLSNKGNMNIGDLVNTGIEFTVTTRPVVTNEVTWTSAFNVGWNRNKITSLADGADTTFGRVGSDQNVQKHAVGHTASSFFVYEQVYDQAGNPLEGVYVDRNGDGEINDADKYIYHAPTPVVTMNWNNTVNWRNWDFGIVLRASLGNWLYNGNMAATSNLGANDALPLQNVMRDVYLFKDLNSQAQVSDYFVQNASFLRCDNITLGYTWKNLLNDNLRLRLYGAVQNPFVITSYKGLDPEVNGSIDSGVYPRPITFTLGVVAQF
ncbi:MAG: TonB-dependent receptor [Duncaniella sp.]|nr:TonB-dependent receptor [Duncaniella sp.]